jgi:hypothetical protein
MLRLPTSHANFDATDVTSFRLEPEVLECLGRTPVEPGGAPIVATALCEVSLRDPNRGSVGCR